MTEQATTTEGAENTAAQPTAEATTANLLGSVTATTEAADATLLGGTKEETTTTTATDPYAWLPEKFRVKSGEDLDFNASAAKMGEAYSNLEKRFGSGEARPADVSGYKFDMGDEFASAFTADPAGAEFLKQAHEMGLNNKQLNFMVNELVNARPAEAETVTGLSQEDAKTQLQETWKEPAEFNRNMLAASQAARHLLKDDYAQFITRYGNDPAIIKMLALVGSEMSEDSLRLAGVPTVSADTVHDLMRNPAYRDETHPDHKRVSQQVRTYFEKTAPRDLHS